MFKEASDCGFDQVDIIRLQALIAQPADGNPD